MKILVLGNSILGLYRFRKELLYEIIKRNHQLYISTPNDDSNNFVSTFEKKGIKYIETKIDRRGINPCKDFKQILNYLRIIKEVNPDYILTYTIKPSIYGSLISKLLGKKYINNITGLGTSFQNKNMLSEFLGFLYKISFSNSKCVFFQNEINMKYFLENKLLNTTKTKIKLLSGSGVNLKTFYPMEKSKLDNKIKFLFIGRIMDEKGVMEYLEVAKKIKKENSNIEFQLLGPYEEEKYKSILLQLQKLGVINYLGVSTDTRVEVKEVDCVINPSWHEGMSNVLLESGAMKKFLIASDIPGCNEIVKNEVTGLTFEVQNVDDLERKVREYLDMKEEEKQRLIDNLYEHIKENFDREKVIEEYMKIIEGVVEC